MTDHEGKSTRGAVQGYGPESDAIAVQRWRRSLPGPANEALPGSPSNRYFQIGTRTMLSLRHSTFNGSFASATDSSLTSFPVP